MFAEVNLQGDELTCTTMSTTPCRKIIKPDLVVYLQADTDVLMQRIAQRDRPYERQMEIDYIHTLKPDLRKALCQPSIPKLPDHQHQLPDYVRNPDDLEAVNQRIRQALKMAPFQESLPIDL
jgi:deoxyguanosine kinase